MRLMFVQYGGDYRNAFRNFSTGGEETYYAQKYSVDAVSKIARSTEETLVVCCRSEEFYDEMLPNGVRAIGIGIEQYSMMIKKLISIIEVYKPTCLIMRTPIRRVFGWAVRNRVRTLGLLADSFSNNSQSSRIQNFLLANLLNNKHIEWVGNHGIGASRSLQDIGVNPHKIVPWDWPPKVSPKNFSSKYLSLDTKTHVLAYVGSIVESKGVGDVLEAICILKNRGGMSLKLKVAGKGEFQFFSDKIKRLSIEDNVEFLGLVSHERVISLMREVDVVVVPSRHEYPEGLPMTIYEGLCCRTPLIVSDHPMFCGSLVHESSALIFPAGKPHALAKCIRDLLTCPDLYRRLSDASDNTWKRLQISVKWADLIERWLRNSIEDREWIHQHCLTSNRCSI